MARYRWISTLQLSLYSSPTHSLREGYVYQMHPCQSNTELFTLWYAGLQAPQLLEIFTIMINATLKNFLLWAPSLTRSNKPSLTVWGITVLMGKKVDQVKMKYQGLNMTLLSKLYILHISPACPFLPGFQPIVRSAPAQCKGKMSAVTRSSVSVFPPQIHPDHPRIKGPVTVQS